MIQLHDLKRQYEALRPQMEEALLLAAASGNYIMGSAVTELEEKLAAYTGVKHCISCASGTDALRMAIMALGIGRGDAVFVPDFTFFATAEVVALQGATPVFVDVRRDSFNIDVDDLNAKYQYVVEHTDLRPVAVIAVDLFGQPADYNKLCPLCDSLGMKLVEDGAQGFGGAIGNRKACSFGDISTTSFFPSKPLGCYGDGGAMFTDDDNMAEILKSLRVHGKGIDKYDNVRVGLNSRLDTIQASVLLVKLRYFDEELKAVNKIAERYKELLYDKVTVPSVPQGMLSSWAQYTIQCSDRDIIQMHLKSAGISSAVYYPRTMSGQTAFASYSQKPCPVADSLTQTVLSLPMHPYLTDEEIEMIAAAI